ncbi:MAG: S1 RNA-binding domain-containing protein, partial [Planctomycetales bacterium]|nr:S1 RNA-binding domain-containing protein [Planctomycetales bacterium]
MTSEPESKDPQQDGGLTPDSSSDSSLSDTPTPAAPAPDVDEASEATAEPVGVEPAAPAASAEASASDDSTEGDRPSERLRIGTQRGDESADAPVAKPAPVAVGKGVSPPQPSVPKDRTSYPPPNVRDKLSDELQREFDAVLEGSSVDDLLNAPDAAPAELAPETRLTATVASLHEDDVFVDLGGHNQGVIPAKQFDTLPEIGAAVDVVVARFDADQGLYEVALPTAAVDVGNWDEVEAGQIIEVSITGSNKGGLECQVAGIRGFIPMGQISIYRIENPEEFVGQRLACVITEANRSRKNLVLSHRALMERERKEKKEQLLAELAPGQIRDGVVRSLQDFGAFVDLGG